MDHLHPYDGKERRFRHTDRDPTQGIRVVMRVLNLPTAPALERLSYDMSFYSGGMGVFDNLAISLPVEPLNLTDLLVANRAHRPSDALADATWKEDFLWLVCGEAAPATIDDAVAAFINEERSEFQQCCRSTDPVWFTDGSNVNDWAAFWHRDGLLSFASVSQG